MELIRITYTMKMERENICMHIVLLPSLTKANINIAKKTCTFLAVVKPKKPKTKPKNPVVRMLKLTKLNILFNLWTVLNIVWSYQADTTNHPLNCLITQITICNRHSVCRKANYNQLYDEEERFTNIIILSRINNIADELQHISPTHDTCRLSL